MFKRQFPLKDIWPMDRRDYYPVRYRWPFKQRFYNFCRDHDGAREQVAGCQGCALGGWRNDTVERAKVFGQMIVWYAQLWVHLLKGDRTL